MNADKYFFPAGSHLHGSAGVACVGQRAFCPAPWEAGMGDGQTSKGSQLRALGTGHKSSHPLPEPELPGGWWSRRGEGAPREGGSPSRGPRPHSSSFPKRDLGTGSKEGSHRSLLRAWPLCLKGSRSERVREAACAVFVMERKHVFPRRGRDKVSSSGD